MKKKIAIIGAEGQMGKWFSRYFLEKDYDIIGYDSEKEILNKSVTKAQSLVGAILTADYVILCIPVKRTPETIRLIAKEMKRDSYLIDISSLKTKTAAALSKIPDKVNPICIHPMFGPGTKKPGKQYTDRTTLRFPCFWLPTPLDSHHAGHSEFCRL